MGRIGKRSTASAISLPATWEEYLKQLSSKERGKIGLRTRKLEKKYKVRIRKCSEESEIDPFLQTLFDLHGKHWQLRVFSLQKGFDPDYSADSVGYVLRSQVLKNLIAEGICRYDFLGGADESKLRWGAKTVHYMDLRFARPMSIGAAYLRTHDYAAQTKSWLRRNLQSVWQMLHKTNVGIKGVDKKTPSEKPAEKQN
jgi:CelD/BcsL family acetyltransferase involved in cellulose biosynthesis